MDSLFLGTAWMGCAAYAFGVATGLGSMGHDAGAKIAYAIGVLCVIGLAYCTIRIVRKGE